MKSLEEVVRDKKFFLLKKSNVPLYSEFNEIIPLCFDACINLVYNIDGLNI